MNIKRIKILRNDFSARSFTILFIIFLLVFLFKIANEGYSLSLMIFLGLTLLSLVLVILRVQKVYQTVSGHIENQIEGKVTNITRSGRILRMELSYQIGEEVFEKRLTLPKTLDTLNIDKDETVQIVYNTDVPKEIYIIELLK